MRRAGVAARCERGASVRCAGEQRARERRSSEQRSRGAVYGGQASSLESGLAVLTAAMTMVFEGGREEAFELTSHGLDTPVSSRPDGWDALRHTGALGPGLWETTRPRLVTADPGLSNALGRAPAALDGCAAQELEYNHPFAWSVEAWRRHLRTVQTFDRVEWPTWLLPPSGPAVQRGISARRGAARRQRIPARRAARAHAPARTRRRPAPAQSRRSALRGVPVGADGTVIASNARASVFLECTFDARQKRYRRSLPGQLLSAEREALGRGHRALVAAAARGRGCLRSATLGSKRPDGTLAWFLVSAAPEETATREPHGLRRGDLRRRDRDEGSERRFERRGPQAAAHDQLGDATCRISSRAPSTWRASG